MERGGKGKARECLTSSRRPKALVWPPRAPAHVSYMYVGKTLKHTKREEENENPGVVVSVNTVFRRQRQEELHVIMSLKPV